MHDTDWLASKFEEERQRLEVLAYRMLGSQADAEDAVQEAWLRLTRTDPSAVENLGGWLTTVLSRVCLDQLRGRRRHGSEPLDEQHETDAPVEDAGPEHEALLGESIGVALLVVLDALEPAERVAFVLHDMFAVPFEDIAAILERSPAAARQLASRARRRVQGADAPAGPAGRQRQVVEAFLAASRSGDFQALLALLDPKVVLRADDHALALSSGRQGRGAPDIAPEVHGPEAVATTFSGRAAAAKLALVGGLAGAAWAPGGRPRVVFRFTTSDGTITGIDLIADPDTIAALEVALVAD